MTSFSRLSSSVNSAGPARWFWDAIALLVVVAIGLLNLVFPFASDQAVAITGAQILASGGTLYVDFWDNKMPGLFWFYLGAGKLFGFTEVGVHLFELIWMFVFGGVLIIALRTYFMQFWIARLVPIVVVGIYYAAVEAFALTQLEILIALPIFISLWLTNVGVSNETRSRTMFLGAGLAAGTAVLFKLVFAPLFVVFWLIASAYLVLRYGNSIREIILRIWLPVSVGVVAILGAVALKFWADDALEELLWTAFVYPPEALRTSPRAPYNQLFESLLFLCSYYAAWGGFIIFAVYRWWRTSRDLFTSLLLAWLATGLMLLLIQRFSWWPYHFLVLFTPAGILAVRGLSELTYLLRESVERKHIGVAMLAILLTIPPLGAMAVPIGQKTILYVKTFARTKGDVEKLQILLGNSYGRIKKNIRFLNDRTALPGKIYVFGDPLYYYLSERTPAAPVIGWPWVYFLQSQWVLLPEQLAASNPAYIYVDRSNKLEIERRGGGVKEYIGERYLPLLRDERGTWFILKPAYRKAAKP